MKYYLLKVDEYENWFVTPLTNDVLMTGNEVIYEGTVGFTQLTNFEDIGYFIQREVRVNLGE